MMTNPGTPTVAPSGPGIETTLDSRHQSRGWYCIFNFQPRVVHARSWMHHRGLLSNHRLATNPRLAIPHNRWGKLFFTMSAGTLLARSTVFQKRHLALK